MPCPEPAPPPLADVTLATAGPGHRPGEPCRWPAPRATESRAGHPETAPLPAAWLDAGGPTALWGLWASHATPSAPVATALAAQPGRERRGPSVPAISTAAAGRAAGRPGRSHLLPPRAPGQDGLPRGHTAQASRAAVSCLSVWSPVLHPNSRSRQTRKTRAKPAARSRAATAPPRHHHGAGPRQRATRREPHAEEKGGAGMRAARQVKN